MASGSRFSQQLVTFNSVPSNGLSGSVTLLKSYYDASILIYSQLTVLSASVSVSRSVIQITILSLTYSPGQKTFVASLESSDTSTFNFEVFKYNNTNQYSIYMVATSNATTDTIYALGTTTVPYASGEITKNLRSTTLADKCSGDEMVATDSILVVACMTQRTIQVFLRNGLVFLALYNLDAQETFNQFQITNTLKNSILIVIGKSLQNFIYYQTKRMIDGVPVFVINMIEILVLDPAAVPPTFYQTQVPNFY